MKKESLLNLAASVNGFFFAFLYKNGIYCLKSGNAVNIENVLPLKTIVPIVFDDSALDDPLKYDNNDNER